PGPYWVVETVTPAGFTSVAPQKVTVGLAQTVTLTLDDPVTPVTSTITITVDKTNDANGDGTFTDSETAPSAGASVPFRAVITNTSTVDVVLDTLTDAWPGQTTASLAPDRPGLAGTARAAGPRAPCLLPHA